MPIATGPQWDRYQPKDRKGDLTKGDLEDVVNDFFDICDSKKVRYTKRAFDFHLITSLDIDTKELKNIKNRKDFQKIFSWARYKIDMQLEQNALDLDKKTSTTFTQFLLKNHSGYSDKVESEQKITTEGEIKLNLDEQIKEARKAFGLDPETGV